MCFSVRGGLLSLLVVWSAAVVPAQQYSFVHYGQEQGLGDSVVRALAQDVTGFLWIGVQNGLYRFDGADFKRYGLKEGLPSNSIHCLHTDPSGSLWIGTVKGVARIVNGQIHKVDVGANMVMRGHGIASDPAGRIYVLTTRGVFASQPGGRDFRRIDLPANDAGEADFVHGIWVDRRGSVWMGYGEGILRLSGSQFTKYGPERGLPPGEWSAFAEDAQGRQWARSGSMLARLENNQFSVAAQLPEPGAGALLRDGKGRLLAAAESGVYEIGRQGARRLLDRSRGLPLDSVSALLEDREGSLWIGSSRSGLARWRGRDVWESWRGTGSGSYRSLLRDASGVFWAGGVREILRGEPGSWTRIPLEGEARAMAESEDGTIYVGTRGNGLFRLDPAARSVKPLPSVPARRVYRLLPEPGGAVLALSAEGAFRLRGSEWQAQFTEILLPGEILRERVTDEAGTTWLAGNRGLIRLRDGKVTRFRTSSGILDDELVFLTAAADGAIWIGYHGEKGVTRLTAKGESVSMEHFGAENFLRSANITFLRSDRKGRVWVGTDNGVDLFDCGVWRHFGTRDGLVWYDTILNSFWEDRDGSVWIGTVEGLAHHMDAAPTTENERPPVVISEMRYGGRLAAPGERLRIPYGNRQLSFRYGGISYARNHDLRYRYRLDEGGTQWVETTERTTVFPALQPGRYRFEVQASVTGGEWSAESAAVEFEILAPWWRSWWFVSLGIAASALASYLLWRGRARKSAAQRLELEAAVRERTWELEQQRNRTQAEMRTVEQQKQEIERLLERAEESNRLKGEFLANVSHEIRTPMNGILGMTSLALETPLSTEQREYLETAKSSGEALLTLLNDILDLSKIEANRLDLETLDFSLAVCIEEAARTVALSAQQKGLTLRVTRGPEIPDALKGDPVRLRQVLLNLLSNAIKFTSAGFVHLSVSAEKREAQYITLQFTVADSGEGIPQDKKDAIFEAFRQADGSVTRRHGGTGLGLAICRRLVNLMHGRIWVDSEPGKGSSFHFTARFEVASDAAPPASHQIQRLASVLRTGGTGKLRILVAEDNPVNQRVLVRLLEKQGHEIDVASDGMDALRRATTTPYQLILMDVQMPSLDGLEATRLIRDFESQTKRERVPILVLSANAMPGDREKGIAAGADGYLTKPVSLVDLVRAIENTLNAYRSGPTVDN